MNELPYRDSVEIGILAIELNEAAHYAEIKPDWVKEISKVLLDWAYANAEDRRIIFNTWRKT